jgi:hypothetical protein
MVRRIRAMAENGTPFDKVAILLRNVERYQPMLEEAMSRAAIPVYFSMGSARPDPAGRAFLALLGCAADGCSATGFAEYLSIGETRQVDSSGYPVQLELKFVLPEDEILGLFTGAKPVENDNAGDVTGPRVFMRPSGDTVRHRC